jgi:hypothetical protein
MIRRSIPPKPTMSPRAVVVLLLAYCKTITATEAVTKRTALSISAGLEKLELGILSLRYAVPPM